MKETCRGMESPFFSAANSVGDLKRSGESVSTPGKGVRGLQTFGNQF